MGHVARLLIVGIKAPVAGGYPERASLILNHIRHPRLGEGVQIRRIRAHRYDLMAVVPAQAIAADEPEKIVAIRKELIDNQLISVAPQRLFGWFVEIKHRRLCLPNK